jgi:hypothetical protein
MAKTAPATALYSSTGGGTGPSGGLHQSTAPSKPPSQQKQGPPAPPPAAFPNGASAAVGGTAAAAALPLARAPAAEALAAGPASPSAAPVMDRGTDPARPSPGPLTRIPGRAPSRCGLDLPAHPHLGRPSRPTPSLLGRLVLGPVSGAPRAQVRPWALCLYLAPTTAAGTNRP